MKRILLGFLACGIAGALAGCVPPSSIRETGAVLAPGAAPRYGPVIAEIEGMIRETMSRSRIPGLLRRALRLPGAHLGGRLRVWR